MVETSNLNAETVSAYLTGAVFVLMHMENKGNKINWMIETEGENENKTNKIQECKTVD